MRKTMVYTVLVFGGIALLICIAGLALTLSGKAGDPVETISTNSSDEQNAIRTTTNPDSNLFVLALGDSLSTGAGDEQEVGYVGRVAEGLQKTSETEVTVSNQAVNGRVASELLSQLQEAQTKSAIQKADVILLSIGGNDLFRNGETLASLDDSLIRSIEQEFSKRLPEILNIVRAYNEEAPITMIGLYNPFNMLETGAQTNEVVRRWNEQVSRILSNFGNTVLVPSYDLYDLNAELYLADDRFHPNGAGYEKIAQRVLQALPQSLVGNIQETVTPMESDGEPR